MQFGVALTVVSWNPADILAILKPYIMTCPAWSMQMGAHDKVKGWSVNLNLMRKHGALRMPAETGFSWAAPDAELRCWHPTEAARAVPKGPKGRPAA
jgi:hypothetical protein